jgi:hypothetical protein
MCFVVDKLALGPAFVGVLRFSHLIIIPTMHSAENVQVYFRITGSSFQVWKRALFVKLCCIFQTYVGFRLYVLRPKYFHGQISSGDAGLQHYLDNSLLRK